MRRWRMPAFIDQDCPTEQDDLLTILIEARRSYGDDPGMRPRKRFTHIEHLRARVDSVSLKNRSWEAHLVPSQISYGILRNVAHALPSNQCECQTAIDKWST